MTVEQFRTALRAELFRPFVMHLADGREVPVKHPELAVSTSTHGETVRAFLPHPLPSAGIRNVGVGDPDLRMGMLVTEWPTHAQCW